METQQAATAAVPGTASSQPQGENKAQPAKSPENKADPVSPGSDDDAAPPGWDLDKFFEQTPWLLLPKEMSTGTKLDEAGRSYMFLHNAPVDNYLALDINDGYEMAAGGDAEFLVEFLRAQLNASERYHVVVVADGNIQRAGVPRWRSDPDWLDHGVFDRPERNPKKGDEENKSPEAQVVGKVECEDSGVDVGVGGNEQGDRSLQQAQPQPHPIEPPLISFLPQKIYYEPPPPPTPQASPSQHDIPQNCSPQVQGVEHTPKAMPLPAFSNGELELFQRFLHFNQAGCRGQHPAVDEQSKVLLEPESRLFNNFIAFLRNQGQPHQCQNLDAIGISPYNACSGQCNSHIHQYSDVNSSDGGGGGGSNPPQQAIFGNACAQMSMVPQQTLPHQAQPQMYFTPQMHGVTPIQGQYNGAVMGFAAPATPLADGSGLPPQPGFLLQNDPNIHDFFPYYPLG